MEYLYYCIILLWQAVILLKVMSEGKIIQVISNLEFPIDGTPKFLKSNESWLQAKSTG